MNDVGNDGGYVEGTLEIASGLRPTGTKREVLDLINRRVAAAFGRAPKAVRVEFFTLPAVIERSMAQKGFLLGSCDSRGPEPIEVGIYLGRYRHPSVHPWQETFLHELTHIYNPEVSEQRVRKLVPVAAKYLRDTHRIRQQNAAQAQQAALWPDGGA